MPLIRWATKKTLKNITAKEVQEYLQQTLNPQNAVAAISGDYSLKHWESVLAQLPIGGAQAKRSTPKAQELKENIYHFEKLDKEQTHIIYGVQGLTLDSSERYILQVLEAVLSGQGGRLFIELRDKASLAYSVSPMKMEGLGAGYFATYIGCSPNKVDTAISMMQEELQKW